MERLFIKSGGISFFWRTKERVETNGNARSRVLTGSWGLGVRWQSEAATPLFMGDVTIKSGVARCFPPQSK